MHTPSMMRYPRRVSVAARVIVTTVLSIALGLILARDMEEEVAPLPVLMVVTVVMGWMALAVYEVLVWLAAAGVNQLVKRLPPRKPAPSRPTAFTPGRGLALILAYFIGSGLIAALLMICLAIAGKDVAVLTADTALSAAVIVISLAGGAATTLLVFRKFATKRDYVIVRRWWRRPDPKIAAGGLAGGAAFALVVVQLLSRLPVRESFTPGVVARMADSPGWTRVWFVMLAIILAPLCEEWLFRGVLLEGLKRRFSRMFAIAVTTAAFGTAHLPDIWGHGPALVAIPLFGWVLAEVRLRTESLVPAVSAHAGYNATLAALAWMTAG